MCILGVALDTTTNVFTRIPYEMQGVIATNNIPITNRYLNGQELMRFITDATRIHCRDIGFANEIYNSINSISGLWITFHIGGFVVNNIFLQCPERQINGSEFRHLGFETIVSH